MRKKEYLEKNTKIEKHNTNCWLFQVFLAMIVDHYTNLHEMITYTK